MDVTPATDPSALAAAARRLQKERDAALAMCKLLEHQRSEAWDMAKLMESHLDDALDRIARAIRVLKGDVGATPEPPGPSPAPPPTAKPAEPS
jgi:hypothetical protein